MNTMESRYQKLVEQMILDKNLPQFVYRMRSVNRFLLDSLINRQIWFSNPQDFNDPFDCDINMSVLNRTAEQRQNYFRQHIQPHFTVRELENINTDNLSAEDFELLLNKLAKLVIGRKGIACFLSSCDNLLMWAHYADAHRGVCLKFDISEDAAFFSPAKKVQYCENYPIYDYLENKNDFVNQMFFTKSVDWSYEGEVRVLKNKKGNYSFKPNALKEIIFGCNIAENDKTTLVNLIRTFYPMAIIKQAVKSPNSFALAFEVI